MPRSDLVVECSRPKQGASHRLNDAQGGADALLLGGPWTRRSTFGPANFSGSLAGASLDTFLAAATAQQLYVALHTTQYPAGALRGQVAPGGRVL